MKKLIGIALFTALLALFLAFKEHEAFLSEYNLKNLGRLISFLAILAIGEGIVIISGGIDLSVGSIVGFSALFLTWLIGTREINTVESVAIVFALMLVVGLVQGFMITQLSIQPFIVTLGGMMVLRGFAQVLTHGGAVGLGPGHEVFQKLGSGFLWSVIPIPAVFMIAIAVICGFLMHQTVFGQYLYAIGRNEEAARFSGIAVGRFKTLAYLLAAALAGIAGILYAPYLSSVQPSFGTAYELYAIAAAVLGGCSLRGGEGAVVGIIIGAALMRLINNGINLLGISTYWEYSVIGFVIILAALLDVFIRRGEPSSGRAKP